GTWHGCRRGAARLREGWHHPSAHAAFPPLEPRSRLHPRLCRGRARERRPVHARGPVGRARAGRAGSARPRRCTTGNAGAAHARAHSAGRRALPRRALRHRRRRVRGAAACRPRRLDVVYRLGGLAAARRARVRSGIPRAAGPRHRDPSLHPAWLARIPDLVSSQGPRDRVPDPRVESGREDRPREERAPGQRAVADPGRRGRGARRRRFARSRAHDRTRITEGSLATTPRWHRRAALALGVLVLALAACRHAAPAAGAARLTPPIYAVTPVQEAFLDTLEERTFRYFWKTTDPTTGLTPDRAPTPSFCSIAAVGFALTAYPIGVERHSIQRWQAVRRVKNTLRFFLTAKQGPSSSGVTGYHGFFYHFLDMKTGTRFKDIELSTIDTALLMGGVLFCQSYFNREEPDEIEIRAMAETLYARVEWDWAQTRAPLISHGWTPGEGFLQWEWRGMNESQIVELLALGSPTHPVKRDSYLAWLETCKWGKYYDQEHIGFAPLFGHQYTQVWYDLAGLQDSLMAAHGIDWFENSRRATLAQYAYAKDNPGGWRDYGPNFWGLTACDGPM